MHHTCHINLVPGICFNMDFGLYIRASYIVVVAAPSSKKKIIIVEAWDF